jgi:virulence-associated protein VapD
MSVLYCITPELDKEILNEYRLDYGLIKTQIKNIFYECGFKKNISNNIYYTDDIKVIMRLKEEIDSKYSIIKPYVKNIYFFKTDCFENITDIIKT